MEKKYWRERFIEEESRVNQLAGKEIKKQQAEYDKAITRINQDIEVWYNRIAKNNDVTLANAKEILNKKEREEFKWTVEEYIKKGSGKDSLKFVKELENASAKYHIERLEAMKLQVRAEIEKLYNDNGNGFKNYLGNLYEDQYNHTFFEIAKGTSMGIGSNMYKLNDKLVNTVISNPWASDGKHFSDRIWEDKEKLLNALHTEMTQAFIRGDKLDTLIKKVVKRMGTSKGNVARLVYTESAAYASKARIKTYEDLNVERYEVVATLDSRTSEICQSIDGKVFEFKDYEIGTTAPPFHVNCRTTTAPYFEDEKEGERAARDKDGKTYYVPANMKYKDWEIKYANKRFVNTTVKVPEGRYRLLGNIKDSRYNSVEELLQKYEEKIVKNTYESAMVVTERGEIYVIKGDSNSLPIHKIETIPFENASITHNHPKGLHEWGFSGGDFDIFRNNNFKYMRAIDEKYVHELDLEIYDVEKYLEGLEDYIKKPNELLKLDDEERNRVLQMYFASEKKLRYRRFNHGY